MQNSKCRNENSITYTSAFAFRKVTEENFTHEMNLLVTWWVEKSRRKITFKGTKQQRTEIQLKVIIVIRFVINTRVQSQPVRSVRWVNNTVWSIPNTIPHAISGRVCWLTILLPIHSCCSILRHWFSSTIFDSDSEFWDLQEEFWML